jgi:hypothetical protein
VPDFFFLQTGFCPSDYQYLQAVDDSLRKKRFGAHQQDVGSVDSAQPARRRMMNQGVSPQRAPQVTIRVSGKLFQGHLAYLDQLVQSAGECQLWPVLSLSNLEELDRTALVYLVNGEDHDFGIASCPNFIREWMNREKDRAAA